MDHLSVRRRALALAAFSSATLLGGCEAKQLKQLDTGITKDSAMSIISQDAKPGSGHSAYPNVYTRGQYLVNGKTLEVLYFSGDDKTEPDKNGPLAARKDTIPLRKLTPIVFLNNTLIGRGWDKWDSVAKANKIPVPPK
jgi:hypothetical protein